MWRRWLRRRSSRRGGGWGARKLLHDVTEIILINGINRRMLLRRRRNYVALDDLVDLAGMELVDTQIVPGARSAASAMIAAVSLR